MNKLRGIIIKADFGYGVRLNNKKEPCLDVEVYGVDEWYRTLTFKLDKTLQLLEHGGFTTEWIKYKQVELLFDDEDEFQINVLAMRWIGMKEWIYKDNVKEEDKNE